MLNTSKPYKISLGFALWAQLSVPGYVLFSFALAEDSFLETLRNLLTQEWHTLVYIEVGTTVAFLILGFYIGKLFTQLTERNLYLQELDQERERFIAATSHDLRSPIGNILNSACLIEEKNATDVDKEQALQWIKSSAKQLLALSNDTLELTQDEMKQSTLRLSPINLKTVLETAIKTIEPSARIKKVHLQYMSTSKTPLWVQGNQVALSRIINNLLSNAIKFTDPEGTVTISILEKTQGLRGFKIVDTGIGIPQKLQPYLFDRFTKASRLGTTGEKSTGLGMSIVKTLVNKQRGSIHFSSMVDEGTQFTVLFPKAAKPRKVHSRNHPQIKGKKILVVDDDPISAVITNKILSSAGNTVETASNGASAVKKFKSKNYDCIIMDRVMPVLNGMEATKMIRCFEKEQSLEYKKNRHYRSHWKDHHS